MRPETRCALPFIGDTSISGIRVARELDRLVGERGKPKTVVSDKGTDAEAGAQPFDALASVSPDADSVP